jgi:flagellar hook-associated protein 1 FlgK
MTDSKRLAIAAPLGAAIAPGGSGTLTIPASGQPTLTTKFDIYDTATTTAMQNGLKSGQSGVRDPSADGTTQSYQLLDAKVRAQFGSIQPGQSNTLSLNIPLKDSTGSPIHLRQLLSTP